ncbi:TIGR03032 family protein [Flavobacteriales bacterium]|jgi:hypothetical protein|nr:TIGR03032 family protein [Flavobacteriales bacterium]
MKREIPFTTLQDINKKSNGRDIVLFGSGIIAEKTARILTGKKIVAIVDNASNLWGQKQLGVNIISPEYLKDEGKNSFVLICTTSFVEVAAQLDLFGMKAEYNYYVSPVMNDLRIIDELETIEKRMLFTSGSPKVDNDGFGGGIYEMNVKGDEWEHKKVISGNCYGLIKYGDNFISVDTEKGIFEFNREYKIIRQRELPSGIRAHGVDYSEKHEKFFVVGSYLDGVIILDKDFNILDQINVSYKRERTGKPDHHCNDCLVVGDSLYVSMFSMTGNWKRDVFDGAIMEYDLVTKELVGPVIQNLWMPHNIKFIEGSLHVLDSLPGQLKTNNAKVIGEFPAFTRGLAHDGVYYFIGQSRNRNYSKNIGVSKNVSIDAGIIVFDGYTKASRFLQLPPKISELHSIHLLD